MAFGPTLPPEYATLLASDEGSRLTVYDDATGRPILPGSLVVGHPTIGIGRNLNVGISLPEQAILFANDQAACISGLRAALPWFDALPDPVAYVLVNMAFNLGLHGLLGFPRMLAAIQAGNMAVARAELLDSGAARELPVRYGRLADILHPAVVQDAGIQQ